MDLGLEQRLSQLVEQKYTTAKQSGSLTFSETQLALIDHRSSNTTFQVRYCPALSHKPTSKDHGPKETKDKKPSNPFLNPDPSLLITAIPPERPTHNLILNKFPIIPQHFLLATSAFELQTDPLTEVDLAAAHACLSAWSRDSPSDELFAFFNSGPKSGASQPHRHIQFLPVAGMTSSSSESSSSQHWRPLVSQLLSRPSQASPSATAEEAAEVETELITDPFPLRIHRFDLSAPPAPRRLHAVYTALLSETFRGREVTASLTREVSYNLALTTMGMAVCARRRGGYAFGKEGDGREIGVNGTVLAGTVLVKDKEEWEWLRCGENAIGEVLRCVVGDADGGTVDMGETGDGVGKL